MENVFTIEQVFSERLLKIPDYQRGYSWEQRQLTDFVEDLELLGSGRDHYTGTVILHPQNSNRVLDAEGKSYEVVHVVDGQQRLTTIVIFLDSIRRQLAALGLSTLAEGIAKIYVATRDMHDETMMKLSLNRDANEYWRDQILAESSGIVPPTILSHRRLDSARLYFSQHLLDRQQELGDTEYRDWLLETFKKISHQLKVTLYSVHESAEVGVIFEVMNDRGKPLTELEKVKNFLLYMAAKLGDESSDLADIINQSWRDILENLMRAGLTDFEDQLLRVHWLMSYEPQARLWNQSKSVKERFSPRRYESEPSTLRGDLLEYTRGLREASLAFCEIMNPRHSESFAALPDPSLRGDVQEVCEKLRRTRQLASFLPLLLAARIQYQSEPQVLLNVLRLCEKLAFRVYLLLRAPSHSGQTALFRIGHLLHRGQLDPADVLVRVQNLCARLSPNARFEGEFDLDHAKDWYAWAGIKYFLYEYEEYLTGSRGVKLSWDQLDSRDKGKSIEHVLPQTPDDPYWTVRFTPEERELLTHDIGNLCLTYDNSSYLNHPFPRKKGWTGALKKDGKTPLPCYANSILMQEHALAAYDEWTPATVRERRAKIVEWALHRWHVDEPVALPDRVEASMARDTEDDEVDELSQSASASELDTYDHAALTGDEASLSVVLPSRDNPYVIQPYNRDFYREGSKGATGQCSYCTREAKWSCKGIDRWFSFCSPHMSRWTGWENRAGRDEVDTSDLDQPPPPARSAPDEWTWDNYIKFTDHSPAKMEVVKILVERAARALGEEATETRHKNQIVFRIGGRKMAAVQFWGQQTRLMCYGLEEPPIANPFEGIRVDARKHGVLWCVRSPAEIPLEMNFLRSLPGTSDPDAE